MRVAVTLPVQSFERSTGVAGTFTLAKNGAGRFSGYESFFWTNSTDCTGTIIAALNGTFDAGVHEANGTTSSVTLAQVSPAAYSLCYHDGHATTTTYAYMPSIQLVVKGRCGCIRARCADSGVWICVHALRR